MHCVLFLPIVKTNKKEQKMEKVYLLKESELNQMITNAVTEALDLFTPPTQERKEEKLLTTNEACEVLRCSKPTLHRWKKEGIIPHVRIGANIRYKESDINNLINK